MNRAIRLELVKPLSERWEDVGPTMNMLASATPKLLNAAMDARIAIDIAGRDAVKDKVAPEAKAASSEGLSYQAVLKAADRLRVWGAKEKNFYSKLEVPGAMASAISRVASKAFCKRKQTRPYFESKLILVRGDSFSLKEDDEGVTIKVKLRTKGAVIFAVASSCGVHHGTLQKILSGEFPIGDCKIVKVKKKWYAIISYECQPQPNPGLDPDRALIAHRGVNNVLYLLATSGQSKSLPGEKFMAQRKQLQERMKRLRKVSVEERGKGARGHGTVRRVKTYDGLEGKLKNVTHTFCQQAAAFLARYAVLWGCGTVIIENYNGIEPDEDPALRRILDRFPFNELKQSISFKLERESIALKETPSAYISTTCPRCKHCDPSNHNKHTGVFHCKVCVFERPADWVASYWMGFHSGVDMSLFEKRLAREKKLADSLRKKKEQDGQGKESKSNLRADRRGVQEAPSPA